MPQPDLSLHKLTFAQAKEERDQWLPLWRQLNESFFPYLYKSLRGSMSGSSPVMRNTKLLDGAPAQALYLLASGFMNGVTSPARKWVNIKRPTASAYEEDDGGVSIVHSQIRTKILEILSASNYYTSRAVEIWDGCGLGTSLMLCYEDRDTVCKFVTCPPGTFSFITNDYNEVVGIARELKMKARDIVAEFGEAAAGRQMANEVKEGKAQSRVEHIVHHIIEANDGKGVPPSAPFREAYWFAAARADAPKYLALRPLYEWPASVFRWHCPDNAPYGVPPTLGALGKAIQLQNLEFKSDQGLDKMISPPVLADYSLRNRAKAFQANGITYTNNLSPNSGARPLLNLQVPFQEIEVKRSRIISSIEEMLFNPLFNMISQLETVRSATEIDARREEKLVMLGPVLQRNYSEDLMPLILRIYGIASRKGLMPELPGGEETSVEFSNVLSDVQKASDVATVERFFGFTGSIVPIFPQVQSKINALDLVKQYAEGLGIRPSSLYTDEEAQAADAQAEQMQQLQQVSEVAKNFGAAAGGLEGLDVGGGLDAVADSL